MNNIKDPFSSESINAFMEKNRRIQADFAARHQLENTFDEMSPRELMYQRADILKAYFNKKLDDKEDDLNQLMNDKQRDDMNEAYRNDDNAKSLMDEIKQDIDKINQIFGLAASGRDPGPTNIFGRLQKKIKDSKVLKFIDELPGNDIEDTLQTAVKAVTSGLPGLPIKPEISPL